MAPAIRAAQAFNLPFTFEIVATRLTVSLTAKRLETSFNGVSQTTKL
jgi:hypothetical protein